MQNKMDASLEDKLLLLLLLRRVRKRRYLRRAVKCVSPRFWMRNIEKREEFGECHCLVEKLQNEDREYFFREGR